MRPILLLGLIACFAAGCRSFSADPFCRTHSAADLTPTKQAYEAMTVAERRDAATRLNEAARRCNWEP